MDVKLPDGTVIRGVPDNITKADLVSRLQRNGYDTSQLAPAPTTGQKVKQGAGNFAAGLVRGAGSIGATLLAPVDAAARAVGIENDFIGRTDRREMMDSGLQTMGAETDSLGYGAGKITGEIAGTAGAGGVLAKGLTAAAPAALRAAPAFNAITKAVGTSGMSTGAKVGTGFLPAAQNLAARAVGGGVTGAASSAMIDPESADTGFLIGAGLPVVAQGAGKVANALGKVIRGPEVAPEIQAAVKSAIDAGYVIPPTQAKPTLANRLMEGMAGKITTAQNASAKNAGVTNKLAANALGLGDDVKITPDVLGDIRKKAGEAYKAIGDELPIRPAQAADSLTNRPAVAAIDPKKMVFDLRKARNEADAWFKSYGRTADPDSLAKAKAAKSAAQEIESTLEGYAKSMGREDLIPDLVKARQLIAKTYSVENALNGTTGNVDAKKLAQQLAKGKPLSGELKQAAEFAARFPKASQTVEGMGSLPQTSPLDWVASGAIGAATSNPLALLGVAARPAARFAALSSPVQNRLSTSPTQNQLLQLLSSPEGQQLLYRAAPPLVTSR